MYNWYNKEIQHFFKISSRFEHVLYQHNLLEVSEKLNNDDV